MSRRNRLWGFLRRRVTHLAVAGGLGLLVVAGALITYHAAIPGLPLIEDFSDTNLRDDARTNANWSTDEQALLLAFRQTRFGGFSDGFGSTAISADTDDSFGLAVGDVDGDGDLDVVAANLAQPNRLYLNNGTSDPFNGVTGSDITSDAHLSSAAALGDLDGDGDLDLVVANSGSQRNRVYLNNGTSDPFNGVTGSDLSTDPQISVGIALGDMDGDGDLDVVVGNSSSQTNRLYLNNGTADPFNGVFGSNITNDLASTRAISLGDLDGDGDLDVVAANLNTTNRLYLNNGTANPFNGVAGSDISADTHPTNSVALGDVDGDGDLDVVAANDFQVVNRVYLNNGTVDPFNGVVGSDLTTDAEDSTAVALGDVDGDGDLDAIVTEFGQVDRIHLNNGSSTPFGNAVTIVTATACTFSTRRRARSGRRPGRSSRPTRCCPGMRRE